MLLLLRCATSVAMSFFYFFSFLKYNSSYNFKMVFTIFRPYKCNPLLIYLLPLPPYNKSSPLLIYLLLLSPYNKSVQLIQTTFYLFSSTIKPNPKPFQFSFRVLCESFQLKGRKNREKKKGITIMM